jgi:hypothetical protein
VSSFSECVYGWISDNNRLNIVLKLDIFIHFYILLIKIGLDTMKKGKNGGKFR